MRLICVCSCVCVYNIEATRGLQWWSCVFVVVLFLLEGPALGDGCCMRCKAMEYQTKGHCVWTIITYRSKCTNFTHRFQDCCPGPTLHGLTTRDLSCKPSRQVCWMNWFFEESRSPEVILITAEAYTDCTVALFRIRCCGLAANCYGMRCQRPHRERYVREVGLRTFYSFGIFGFGS